MTFVEASRFLNVLGVDFERAFEFRSESEESRGRESDLFMWVGPNFEPKEWYQIVSSTGEHYIGECCGNSSEIQDLICKWFRQSPNQISLLELSAVAKAMILHDGPASYFVDPTSGWIEKNLWPLSFSPEGVGILKGAWKRLNPWGKLGTIWLLVKDHCSPDIMQSNPDSIGQGSD